MIRPSQMEPDMKLVDPQSETGTITVLSNGYDKRPNWDGWNRVIFVGGSGWSYIPGGDYDEAAWTPAGDTSENFRRGWDDANKGRIHPISELWNDW